jgi:hypothetical protein
MLIKYQIMWIVLIINLLILITKGRRGSKMKLGKLILIFKAWGLCKDPIVHLKYWKVLRLTYKTKNKAKKQLK